MHIILPRRLEIETLHEIFACYANIIDNYGGNGRKLEDIYINMENCRFATPAGLAALVSFISYIIHLNIANNYRIKYTKYRRLESYLTRIDFYKILGLKKKEGNRHDSAGRFCEIKKINSAEAIRDLTEHLVSIVERQINVDEEFIDAILHCLGEVMENIFHHSNSPIPGFVCAQTYPSKKYIEFSIADAGIGIKRSLQRNEKYANIDNDCKALECAIKKRVTGNPNNNAGEGLFVLGEVIKDNNGFFSIYSGCGNMEYKNNQTDFFKVPKWDGTIVSFRLYTDNKASLTDIFNREFPEDSSVDLDFIQI